MKLGLTSVTFKEKSIEEVVDLTKRAGLSCIEWGGDVHVVHGDVETAKKAREITNNAGLEVSSYGSYYRVGDYGENYKEEFGKILKTAEALGAKTIRIWGNHKAVHKFEEKELEKFREELNYIITGCEEKGIKVAFECHMDTFTEHYPSAVEFLGSLNGMYTYWQPNECIDYFENQKSIEAYAPYIMNVHVANYLPGLRFSMGRGYAEWEKYLELLVKNGCNGNYLIEFLPENTEECFFEEVKYLKMITEKYI